MRSLLQQSVIINHVLAFLATSKRKGAMSKKKRKSTTLQKEEQHEDDWMIDGIQNPKTSSDRSKNFEKCSTTSYRRSKKQHGKSCINNNKKKPKCSVRFDMDCNEVIYRHATDEDLNNAWMSRTELKAIGESIWSTIITIHELTIKNKSEEGKLMSTSTNITDYIYSKYGRYDNDELCLRGVEFYVSPKLRKWKKENRARIRQSVLSTKPRAVINRKDISQHAGEPQQNLVDKANDKNIVVTAFSESLLSEKDELRALQMAMIDSVDAQFIHSKSFQGSLLTIL